MIADSNLFYIMRQFGGPNAAHSWCLMRAATMRERRQSRGCFLAVKDLQAWLPVVTIEHGGADFDTVRPVAAALPGVGLIILQTVGVGLNYLAGL